MQFLLPADGLRVKDVLRIAHHLVTFCEDFDPVAPWPLSGAPPAPALVSARRSSSAEEDRGAPRIALRSPSSSLTAEEQALVDRRHVRQALKAAAEQRPDDPWTSLRDLIQRTTLPRASVKAALESLHIAGSAVRNGAGGAAERWRLAGTIHKRGRAPLPIKVDEHILPLVEQGLSNRQIAKELGIGAQTVNTRLRAISEPQPGHPRGVRRERLDDPEVDPSNHRRGFRTLELTNREQEILKRREAGENRRVIGESMGIGPERVRQLEVRAQRKLRKKQNAEAPAVDEPVLPALPPAAERDENEDAHDDEDAPEDTPQPPDEEEAEEIDVPRVRMLGPIRKPEPVPVAPKPLEEQDTDADTDDEDAESDDDAESEDEAEEDDEEPVQALSTVDLFRSKSAAWLRPCLTREQRRSRRHREVRAKTINVDRLTKRELALGTALFPDTGYYARRREATASTASARAPTWLASSTCTSMSNAGTTRSSSTSRTSNPMSSRRVAVSTSRTEAAFRLTAWAR